VSSARTRRGRVVFIGAVHEARPALAALLASPIVDVVAVLTRTDAATRRLCGAVDLASMADADGVPVLRTDDANSPELVSSVRALDPDLIVVVGWNQLLRPPLLEAARRGCVGFHASLLPRHRGHAPVNWAILRGQRQTGNTMMYLDPGADTGDIVDQLPIAITPDDTCASVYEKVGAAGAQLLIRHLPALLAGTAPRRPQRREDGDVLPRRTPDMGVIDWRRSASQIYDWIRALTAPYPGAFTTADGDRILLWSARRPADTQAIGVPGQIVAIDRSGVRVATGAGSLLITSVGSPGEAPTAAGEWFAARAIAPGAVFDHVDPLVARWALTGRTVNTAPEPAR
jgi:methionyl-tRNA formyltransferase